MKACQRRHAFCYFIRQLERCRRIAVLGASDDPGSKSYVDMEKLLGLGVEVYPILPGCESFLGVRCYPRLRDIACEIDIVQVYPERGIVLEEAAKDAVAKKVKAFWVEEGGAGFEAREILSGGGVQVIEHDSLEREYARHLPFTFPGTVPAQKGRASAKVADRMTRNPVTVKASDGINDAIEKMKRGHFRHLPVVDDEGKLIGMLSDRDIRLIRPSLAFVSPEDAALQIWSTSVRQAAVYDPVTIYPEALLEQAVELMLRWEVGGLPVVDKSGNLVGIITYTDLLHEFVAGERR